MTALLDHFHEAVTTPEDVEKVKKYILQLAMQGKLVEQDPNDEPASELFMKIEEEKERLIKEKKIKKSLKFSNVSQKEIPYEIPNNWNWVKLGMIGDWGAGATPSRGNPEYYNGTIPWLKTGELNDGYIGSAVEYITDLALEKVSLRLNKPGDVLIAMYGATIGKLGILDIESTTNQACCACTPFKGINNKFLFYFLLSQRDFYRSLGAGGAQPNISKEKIVNSVFPLPPFSQQHQIVDRIEELFNKCEHLSSLLFKKQSASNMINKSVFTNLTDHSNPEQLKDLRFLLENIEHLCNDKESISQLRNSILSLAVQGKLVEQEVNAEHASVLIENIQMEKQRLIERKEIKKEKPLPPIKEDEIPYKLPTGWQWVRLGDLSKVIEYGTSQKATEINVGVPVLRMNNIYERTIVYKNLKYVEASIKDLPRLYLKHGDILFNRTNSYELVGKSGCYLQQNDVYTFASYLIRINLFTEYLVPEYVNYYLNSPVCRITQIEPQITQQNGQANFNGTKLKGVLIALPPKEEQRRIVEQMDFIKKTCDDLEKTLVRKEKSRNVLLNVAGYRFV